jgi:hypothetical protein
MPYTAWQTYIEGSDGLPISNATIEVRVESSGSLATIYADKDGAALANPFTSDSNGLARFYAAAGFYKITATSGAYSASFRFVPIGQAMGYDVGTASGEIPTIALADVRYNANLNHNLAATSAPTVNDDESAGYEIQSVWVDVSVSPDQRYICLDNTEGAAVWVEVYSTVGGTSADLITYNNATSGLTATDVQDALDEIEAQITGENLPFTAATGGTIAATDVSGAINELDTDIQALPTLASGTWTPTISTTSNITATNVYTGRYLRVGDIVYFSVSIDINATSADNISLFLSLPVASNFAASANATGIAIGIPTSDAQTMGSGIIYADDAGDKLFLNAWANFTGLQEWAINGSYLVI